MYTLQEYTYSQGEHLELIVLKVTGLPGGQRDWKMGGRGGGIKVSDTSGTRAHEYEQRN